MFIDLEQTARDDGVFRADVCIIGGGAAGMSIAHDMLGSGTRVAVIEGGDLIERDRNQALYAGDSVGRLVDLAVGRYRVLGGSTSRWAGRCATLDPIDLERRDWIDWSGWPITADELNRFYGPAAVLCRLREAMQMAASDPEATDARFADRFRWQFPTATNQDGLNFGLVHGPALRHDDDTTVFLHANVTDIAVDAGTGQITTIRAASLGGAAVTVSARAFVLCCGGIENARILLNTARSIPGGLGNQNDLVGRFFTQHPRGDTATINASRSQASALQDIFNIFPAAAHARDEVGLALPARVQRERHLLNASAMIAYGARPLSGWEAARALAQAARSRTFSPKHLRDVLRVAADPADLAVNLARRLREQRPHRFRDPLIRIVVDVEQAPDFDSRVTLSDRTDAFGWSMASVDWRIRSLERTTARVLTEMIATEIAACHLGTAHLHDWLFEDGDPRDAELVGNYHHIGTTRMAADPRQGVVDPDCRLHGGANMFVAGCSVFPTGGHVNPTLTIVALALRLSAHLKRSLRNGALPTR